MTFEESNSTEKPQVFGRDERIHGERSAVVVYSIYYTRPSEGIDPTDAVIERIFNGCVHNTPSTALSDVIDPTIYVTAHVPYERGKPRTFWPM
jgi:hypothetical protein